MEDCIDHGRTASLNKGGYAKTWYEKKSTLLHRVVYCHSNDVTMASIAGMSVRHTCDNPRCINPAHLVLGTHKENMEDKVSRGRTHRNMPQLRALTNEQAESIRTEYVKYSSTAGTYALAVKYGVSQPVIHKIVTGRHYRGGE